MTDDEVRQLSNGQPVLVKPFPEHFYREATFIGLHEEWGALQNPPGELRAMVQLGAWTYWAAPDELRPLE